MKISKETLNILKNFSTINTGIYIKKGNELKTISPLSNIYASATVNENFPKDFAIFELNKFLGVVSLFDEPDFLFGEKSVKITEGKNSVKYVYTEPSLVLYPSGDISDEYSSKFDITFKLSNEDLQSLLKSSGVMELPDLCISCKEDNIKLIVVDKSKKESSNNFDITLNSVFKKNKDKDFVFMFKIENLKLLSQNYDVYLSSDYGFFKGNNIQYYIATEDFGNE